LKGTEFTEIINCVACNNSDFNVTLDLGDQPLANDFLEDNSNFETYPLKLLRCTSCYHSQLSIAVSPNRLFREYSYISGTSATLSNYFESLAKIIIEEFGPIGKILDIGSNDGSFLSKFKNTSWSVLGVDPAINLIPSSSALDVITVPAFFNQDITKFLAKDFDVIVAMNIFAHTDNPLDILHGIKNCLKENGKAYIQTSQADMFITGQFDTVYHEHISFFNVKSMKALLNRAGLYLSNVTITSIHGNSYLWEISKDSENQKNCEREEFEINQGFYSDSLYLDFHKIVHERVANVKKIVQDYTRMGFLVVSYGAAAKGNTFINFSGIELDYIFDDTPQKIGKYSPAGGCKVTSPKLLHEIKSNLLVVIPAWNFKEEILGKIRTLRNNRTDQYLTYFPNINQESIC
jgi:2-polyprenyl-3-methyl-5-hydroxy-6-metoxy-1,4-benzoquinol methylase